MNVEEVKRSMSKRTKKPVCERPVLSTGSTQLNLALSGRPDAALYKGDYLYLVGDSMSGKTWVSWTLLAEASINPVFDGYRLLYADAERGSRMDREKFFGSRLAERVEVSHPQYLEEWYFDLDDAFDGGKPFVMVLDSMDCLDSFDDESKFDEWKEAFRKGKDSKGSYGMAKAKLNSQAIRRTMGQLGATGSILVVISQTRDAVNTGNPFGGKTRAGGRSLRFYATAEVWSCVTGQIKRTYRGKERQQGVNVRFDVKKNRLTGRKRSADVPIYHDCGFDNIGSNVDWLLAEKVWKKSAGESRDKSITATGIGPELSLPRERLIRHVEEHGLEEDLQDLVALEWQRIEDAVAVKRKSRYA
jgi:RecA/RadA recombinase